MISNWLFGSVSIGNVVGCINKVNQPSYYLMGDRLQVGKPSQYVASHPGQLSLAIPPWVGTMSMGESWDVNRHTTRCTSPYPWSGSVNWCLTEG